jgi:hypothetical protein
MKPFPFSFLALLAGLAAFLPLTAFAYELPDPVIMPGAINETVTQTSMRGTICRKGWTRSIRPPVSYTNRLKHQLMLRYGVGGGNIHNFELDHLIPLELGRGAGGSGEPVAPAENRDVERGPQGRYREETEPAGLLRESAARRGAEGDQG